MSDTPATDMAEPLVDRLRKRANAIFVAADETVAEDISRHLNAAANALQLRDEANKVRDGVAKAREAGFAKARQQRDTLATAIESALTALDGKRYDEINRVLTTALLNLRREGT